METVLHLERMFYKRTETFVINQINAIKKFQVNMACIKPVNQGADFAGLISPPGTSGIYRTKMLRNGDREYLKNKIREKKYALIHSHFISDAAFFNPVTRNIQIPKLASAYGYDVSEFPHRYFGLGKKYLKKAFDEYDLILAMSEDMKNDLLEIGCPEHKIEIHYHGINTAMFNNDHRSYEDQEIYNLISVGTVCEKKGQHLVIEALNILVNALNVKNIRYRIVGTGPYDEIVRKKVNEYHLSPYVHFYGHVSHGNELVELYERADIFIHPCIVDSHRGKEGIPGVIVEAMSNGLPVITTKHAGIPSVISDGFNGLLTDEKNVDQIVAEIQRLIRSETLRTSLGNSARTYAMEHLDMYAKAAYLENTIYTRLTGNTCSTGNKSLMNI